MVLRKVFTKVPIAVCWGLTLSAAQTQLQAAEVTSELAPVTVIANTPLPGIGQPLNELAAPVQTATSRDIQASGASDLADFMNRRLGSVHVNEMQGNPYQLDVNYRGYTASPLLGTPQGLSVYMDGVRMNQPFGDVVSWDLIPRSAISSMTLMPGSNPLFGLNTLGGALSLQTKDGRSNPGTVLTTTLGSHARRSLELEHGGFNDQGLSWFLTTNQSRDQGWRNNSASDVRQLFSKIGWQDAQTDLKLTWAYADNQLNGNGLQEQSMLARDWRSVYTKPDITQNKSTLLNLAASHAIHDGLLFSGNVYYRQIQSASYNGDINEAALDQSASEVQNALINRTRTTQKNHGLSGQLTWLGDWAGMGHQLVAGAGYDASRVNFLQSTQMGYLNADRSVTGINAFADSAPFDNRVDLGGRMQTGSFYVSDTVSLKENLHLTLSGRYNKTLIDNQDQIHAVGDPASLSGVHQFSRLNPAIGLTYSPTKSLNSYAGYSESSRAPTAIELGCANPEQPCKLPNAMAGDPPLKQVIARTLEAGLRGTSGGVLRWNAGVFSTDNRDDILFVADDQAGFGYFKNFGKTRRRGLELGMGGKAGTLELGAQYTLLDATYQSAETVNGSSNSSNSSASAGTPGFDGTIAVRPGDRIPLIPRQMLKLFADLALSPVLMLHGGMVGMSGALARGNENNSQQADGTYYQGSGRSTGYATFNLGANYRVSPQWQWAVQLSNVFDVRYSTAAQLGPNGFDANGNYAARPLGGSTEAGYPLVHSTFYAPGAPRALWLQLRYSFDKAAGG